MDTSRHLDSYRESLKKDAFEECIDYAKETPTARPDKYPTVYYFIKYSLDAAKHFSYEGNTHSYILWLRRHQEAMTLLLERMVTEILFEDGVETTPPDVLCVLMREKGFAWFKFAKNALCLSMRVPDNSRVELVLVPRYATKFKPVWGDPAVAAFDADELRLLLTECNPEVAREVLHYKQGAQGTKFLGLHSMDKELDPVPVYKPVSALNSDVVLDWSLPL